MTYVSWSSDFDCFNMHTITCLMNLPDTKELCCHATAFILCYILANSSGSTLCLQPQKIHSATLSTDLNSLIVFLELGKEGCQELEYSLITVFLRPCMTNPTF